MYIILAGLPLTLIVLSTYGATYGTFAKVTSKYKYAL